MPTEYEGTFELAEIAFKQRLDKCQTRNDAAKLAVVVADSYARRSAGNPHNCLWLLNDNPDLLARRLSENDRADCATIVDFVFLLMLQDLTAALMKLIPADLPRA